MGTTRSETKSLVIENWRYPWTRISARIRRIVATLKSLWKVRAEPDHFPTFTGWLPRNFDYASSLTSSSPFLSLSSLSNSASINVIHSCLEILPLLSVSISSSNCLTSGSPRASLSVGFGVCRFLTYCSSHRCSDCQQRDSQDDPERLLSFEHGSPPQEEVTIRIRYRST
jgi:hypothetical protein